ncbi:hypothetical protein D3C72_2051850 [compost metagenome]
MRGIHRGPPFGHAAGLHEGVDGEQHLPVAPVRQFDACADVCFGEIEPGEVAGVRGVLEPEIDGVGARLYRCFQGGKAAGRGHEFHGRGSSFHDGQSMGRPPPGPCRRSNGAPRGAPFLQAYSSV